MHPHPTIVIFIALLLACSTPASGQTSERITLPADGSTLLSAPTDAGVRYRITVEGTYSMWPQFTDCHGVDAAYVYDVPQAEFDAFRWPPKAIVAIPHWVGDPTMWGYDIIRLSFRWHKGFRIDNEPLPNTGCNPASHRYQIEKMGTGAPFAFQVLDSNYNILEEKVIPRYEDNCGSLKITVEKLPTKPEINICDIEAVCKDGRVVGLRLWAGIFEEDSTQPGGRRNSLKNIAPRQIAIVDNGYVMCDIDSISCTAPAGQVAVGLVIDRSESMGAPISLQDQTIRMTAAKQALTHFIDNMRAGDSAFVLSFASDTRLDLNWTADHQQLKAAVGALQPETKTAFYKAVLEGLEKAAASSAQKRALIVLSDGYNTDGTDWSDAILDVVRARNIPIYILGLGLRSDDADKIGRQRMEAIATASGGRLYEIHQASMLDSMYRVISASLINEDCCAIYFRTSDCTPGTQKFLRIIYAPSDTVILTKVVSYVCPACPQATGVEPEDRRPVPQPFRLELSPVPTNGDLTVRFDARRAGAYTLVITDLMGREVHRTQMSIPMPGFRSTTAPMHHLPKGLYIVVIDGPDGLAWGKTLVE